MSRLDNFIKEIKLQQENFGKLASSGAETSHDLWPQMYAAMWIESLANAVKADLEATTPASDLVVKSPEATTKDTVTSQQGSTIEDKLKETRKEIEDVCYIWGNNRRAARLTSEKIMPIVQAIITTETTKAKEEAVENWCRSLFEQDPEMVRKVKEALQKEQNA